MNEPHGNGRLEPDLPHSADPSFAADAEALIEAVQLLVHHRSAGRGLPSRQSLSMDFRSLPEQGIGDRAALAELGPWYLGGAARLDDKGFFGHMDPPTPWITWAATLWAASVNQNLLHPATAPVAREIETLVVKWLAPFFGMSGGHVVPGSTVANLTALWAARELRQIEEVVASSAAHLSIRKAAHLLRLRFREVPADPRGRIDVTALGDLTQAALVLTAGATATGAIDLLDAGRQAAWRHVDAAWAGPLRISRSHAWLLDGIGAADSVAVSGHKWFFQPKESACVFFADAEAAHGALSFGGGYLAAPNIGLLGSHGATALPLLATLLAWGRRGMAERVDRCMALAETLARLVRSNDRLELFSEPQSGIVLWRPRRCDVPQTHSSLQSSVVSLVTIDGEQWLRSVAANPMADAGHVVECVLSAIRPASSTR
jgi:L-2,4-diaminobutyrate decarboxylase